MRLPTVILIALALGTCAAEQPQHAITVTQDGNITNLEAQGNLQSFRSVGCVEITELTDQNTPADIYPGIGKCIAAGDYDRAAKLFAVGGVYGRFDMQRVRDETAHQAIRVLQQNVLGSFSADQGAKLRDVLNHNSKFSQGSAEHAAMCASLKSLGPPDYYPTYMVKHGIKGLSGGMPGGDLEKDFDAAKAWSASLDTYVHCK